MLLSRSARSTRTEPEGLCTPVSENTEVEAVQARRIGHMAKSLFVARFVALSR